MKMNAAYADDAAIGAVTRGIVAGGTRILQIHRLAETEQGHAEALLRWLDPREGVTVLDAGCGVGGVAEAMSAARPDLRFVLLNASASQLAMCPPQFARIEADFHDIPMPDRCMDVVMFCYCLGHSLIEDLFAEAARIVKPGGVVFAYDLVHKGIGAVLPEVQYMAYSSASILAAAARAGLMLDRHEVPAETFTAHFDRLPGAKTFLLETEPWLARWRKP